jgi:hypothetical protein
VALLEPFLALQPLADLPQPLQPAGGRAAEPADLLGDLIVQQVAPGLPGRLLVLGQEVVDRADLGGGLGEAGGALGAAAVVDALDERITVKSCPTCSRRLPRLSRSACSASRRISAFTAASWLLAHSVRWSATGRSWPGVPGSSMPRIVHAAGR